VNNFQAFRKRSVLMNLLFLPLIALGIAFGTIGGCSGGGGSGDSTQRTLHGGYLGDHREDAWQI